MSRNRRKNVNTVRIATFVWWLLVFVGLSVLGLSYVSIKNQTIAFGEQRRVLESQLRDYSNQNRALGNQITRMKSYLSLKTRWQSGFIKLVEIQPQHIVRLGAAASPSAIVADDATPTQILAQK